MGYKWIGTGGVEYDVEEVDDNHLLSYFRLLQERNQRYLATPSHIPSAGKRYTQAAILVVFDEIEKRGLEPLPLRTDEEQNQATRLREEHHRRILQGMSPEESSLIWRQQAAGAHRSRVNIFENQAIASAPIPNSMSAIGVELLTPSQLRKKKRKSRDTISAQPELEEETLPDTGDRLIIFEEEEK